MEFLGKLRPSQLEILEIARRQLDRGERRIHVVAPPGSGKTVVGLYLWACCVGRPGVVFSPNSAIQSQWLERLDLFRPSPGLRTGTDPGTESDFLSLTYQSVSMPSRGDAGMNAEAFSVWIESLIASGHAEDPQQAREWIFGMGRQNMAYYKERLSFYRKAARDDIARAGGALDVLHASSRENLEKIAGRAPGVLIFDECHHLLGHWGRVLDDAARRMGDPVIIGLTATPPDFREHDERDVRRYRVFFGEVDYEVPVPAVVKDGYLAPYQDLVYFVRPSAQEMAYIAGVDRSFHRLVDHLDDPAHASVTLKDWLAETLVLRRLPTGHAESWMAFERRDGDFADAARRYLLRAGTTLPEGVPGLAPPPEEDELAVLITVLDRYIRHFLRLSQVPEDRLLADTAIRDLRVLGLQTTETGSRPCASPVSRVLSYSREKTQALIPILKSEIGVLGEAIRAVVISDFEKSSAIQAGISDILSGDAGGAVAAFRALLSDSETDALDPVLVTGSSVLVDDDLAERFLGHARTWLKDRGLEVELEYRPEQGFHVLLGRGADWSPRAYVLLVSELFRQGVTRCLVGTRGLLGEGWDCPCVNVLIDLTTVTTSMTVRQLRGRSLRLDPGDADKLADNWDVCCVAPEFTRGFDDYRRFAQKHRSLLGITEDGGIETGPGHVHAAFVELRPEGIESMMGALNEEMLLRPGKRPAARGLWRIGMPYKTETVTVLETRTRGGGGGFPPFKGGRDPWSDASLTAAVGRAVLGALEEAGQVPAGCAARAVERSGGYVRAFLEGATKDAAGLFGRCMRDVLGPLVRPRYILPREVDILHETWLSRLLPEIAARYFKRRERTLVMYHAVPGLFDDKRELALMFTRHWNTHVSPGNALYVQRGEGEKVLEEALKSGLVPRASLREKDVWY